jgi:hypothetical protein
MSSEERQAMAKVVVEAEAEVEAKEEQVEQQGEEGTFLVWEKEKRCTRRRSITRQRRRMFC